MKLLLAIFAAILAARPSGAAEVKQNAEVSVQKVFLDTPGGNPSHKFSEYGPVPTGVVFKRYTLDFDGEDRILSCEARNIVQANQDYRCDGGRPGKMTWSAGWDQTPHVYSNDARSPFRETERGVLTLPTAIRTDIAANAALWGATSQAAQSWNVYLRTHAFLQPAETRDDTATVELRFRPKDPLTFRVAALRSTKQGRRPLGAALGFSNSQEVLEPIDYLTHEMSATLEYAQPRYQASLRYDFSDFENNTPSLTWDSPQRLVDTYANATGYSAGTNGSKGRMALNPSSQRHTITLAGGAELPWNTRFSGDASYGLLLAHNPMQPYTTNTAIKPGVPGGTAPYIPPFDASDRASRPSEWIEGRVNVYSVFLRLVNQEVRNLKTALEWKTWAEVNKSQQYAFPGHVVFDQNWLNANDATLRHTQQTDRLTAKADYELSDPLSVGLNYSLERVRREREVSDQYENSGTASTVWRPNRKTMLNLTYTRAMRRGRNFRMDHQNDTPGLRRPDIADRDRNEGRIQGQYMSDGGVVAGLSTRMVHDAHKPGKGDLTDGSATRFNEMYGIIENRTIIASTDFTVPLNEDWDIDAFYSFENGRMLFRGSANKGAAQLQHNSYTMRQEEISNVGGLSANWRKDQWETSGGYEVVASVMKLDPIAVNAARTALRSARDRCPRRSASFRR